MKEFSKEWFNFIVRKAEEMGEVNAKITLHLLIGDIKNYIDYLDKLDHRRGRPGRSRP